MPTKHKEHLPGEGGDDVTLVPVLQQLRLLLPLLYTVYTINTTSAMYSVTLDR